MGFHQDNSTTYYSQTNNQAVVVNKVFNIMLYMIVDKTKSNWNFVIL